MHFMIGKTKLVENTNINIINKFSVTVRRISFNNSNNKDTAVKPTYEEAVKKFKNSTSVLNTKILTVEYKITEFDKTFYPTKGEIAKWEIAYS